MRHARWLVEEGRAQSFVCAVLLFSVASLHNCGKIADIGCATLFRCLPAHPLWHAMVLLCSTI